MTSWNWCLHSDGHSITCIVIGVSLSEPHTSGLHCTDVCVYDRQCLWPYTANFKCMFKYFPKIEHPRALAWECKLLPECSVANHNRDGSSLRMHGTLLLVVTAAMDWPSMAGCSPTVNVTNSAYHFSVKLSLLMCMLAACSGSPPQCSAFSSLWW